MFQPRSGLSTLRRQLKKRQLGFYQTPVELPDQPKWSITGFTPHSSFVSTKASSSGPNDFKACNSRFWLDKASDVWPYCGCYFGQMAQNKKLQVFVSSTYEDLKEERQAAVEAILTAGHIPAGMELFAAGDQSQMEVIKRWIDESDVFLLILGGRYGSIDPTTKKSYIQLEYEYAQEKGKPFFAVVIDETYLDKKVKSRGRKVLENSHPQELKAFRETVRNKLVKMWSDPRDIKLAILETLSGFSRREDLVGWIPGDQAVDTSKLVEDMNRQAKENESLRDQLAEKRIFLSSLVTKHELGPLKGLKQREFLIRFEPELYNYLHRLDGLNFIQPNSGFGLYDIVKEHEEDKNLPYDQRPPFDLKKYVHITDEGTGYLDALSEILKG
jgi:hypothetical protein